MRSETRQCLGLIALSVLCGVSAGRLSSVTVDSGSGRAIQPAQDPGSAVRRSQLRERAIDTLLKLTTDDNPVIRANAIEGLLAVPSRLGPVLPSALADPNPGVRAVAAMAVGRVGACDLAALVRPLASDASAHVRVAALFALGRCDRQADIHELAQLLLESREPGVRAQAAFALGELGNRSALPLLRQAGQARIKSATDTEVRLLQLQIAEAMYKLGDDEQIQTIHSAMFVSRPEDLEATALAAQILGELKSRKSVPELINLLAWRDEQGNEMPVEIRLAAAIALAKLGHPNAESVADEVESDASPLVLAQMAVLLGEVGSDAALSRLERLLGDERSPVRVSAAAGVANAIEDRAQVP